MMNTWQNKVRLTDDAEAKKVVKHDDMERSKLKKQAEKRRNGKEKK